MAPAITSFTPTTGNSSGGTPVTITGTGFIADLTSNRVLVGGALATIVGTPTTTTIVIRTPPGTPASTPKISVLDLAADLIAQSSGSYTYAATATLETLVAQLARRWKVDIDVSVAQDGSNYIPVRGVNSVKPGLDAITDDDSDFDSNGWGSTTKTGINWSLDLGLVRKVGLITLAEDPGQAALRAAAVAFGSAGTVRVRWYDRNDIAEAYYGFGTVSWSPDGGDWTKVETVSATISGQGQRNSITNPLG